MGGEEKVPYRREVPVAGEYQLTGGGRRRHGGVRCRLRGRTCGPEDAAGGAAGAAWRHGHRRRRGQLLLRFRRSHRQWTRVRRRDRGDVVRRRHRRGGGWQVQRSAPLQRENHTNYHAILPLVLQRLARDAGVELLFCTDVVGTVTDSRRITEVVLHNRSLLHAVRAPLFVDATRRHSGPACRCANPAGGRPGAAADDQAEPDDIPAPGRRGAASAATTCSASTMSAPGASSATASRRLLHHRRPQLR